MLVEIITEELLAVAYGAQERKVRLHMNLGFSF